MRVGYVSWLRQRFALLGSQTGEIQTDKFQVSSGQVDRYSENDMKKNLTVIILSAMLLALCGSAEANRQRISRA